MKMRGIPLIALGAAFLLGVSLSALIVWNPAGWQWAKSLTGRLGSSGNQEPQTGQEQLWTCGMHPQVLQDHPGNCPICGMKLVPVGGKSLASGTATEQKERKIKYWRAPMDPNYISDKPGKSPMGMDLIPVYEEEEPAASGIHVDPSFLQNFAVRTEVVERGSIPIDNRTLGILDYNQKTIVSISTKFEGWIEKAHVNYVGEVVKKGDVLFETYSPQLVTTQQEYLAGLAYLAKLSNGGIPESIDRARSLVEATRERLRYWDITDEQIANLRENEKITRRLNIYSPISGIVIQKMSDSLEGTKITPGMSIYKIADLSTIWAAIEVFENQIRYLHLGETARITLDAFPGRQWTGRISYIDPTVRPQTRTLKAYVEISNPGWNLRPEMYANVELHIPAVSGAIRVPSEAVLHTGDRNVVVVQKSEGFFEPREIELGATGGGYDEVRRGLQPGETIVTSSQFLIDSESNLKEAISKMLATRKSESSTGTAPETDYIH